MSILSRNIRFLRKHYGLTQQQLADVFQMDRSTFSYYESGKVEPTLTLALQLSQYFLVSLENLVSYDFTLQESPNYSKHQEKRL